MAFIESGKTHNLHLRVFLQPEHSHPMRPQAPVVSATGGFTVLWSYDRETGQVEFQLTACHPKENYNRKLGRQYASEKPIQVMDVRSVLLASVENILFAFPNLVKDFDQTELHDFVSRQAVEAILVQHVSRSFGAHLQNQFGERLTGVGAFHAVK